MATFISTDSIDSFNGTASNDLFVIPSAQFSLAQQPDFWNESSPLASVVSCWDLESV